MKYCEGCGAELEDTMKFCPRCGKKYDAGPNVGSNIENDGQIENEQEKKNKAQKPSIGIAVVCLVVAVIIGLVAYRLYLGAEERAITDTVANYEEVNDAITDLTTSPGYAQLETSEKAAQVLELLRQLENKGQIALDSIEYNTSTQIIAYEYANGAYGGVMLEDFAEGISGIGEDLYRTTYSYDATNDSYSVGNWPAIPVFASDAFPYEEKNLRAIMMYGLGDDHQEYLELSKQEQSVWRQAHLVTTLDDDCTISDFRTKLTGNDLIIIQEHGVVYKDNPLIVLQEIVNFSTYLANKAGLAYTLEGQLYLKDLQEKRIVMLRMTNGEYHTCLLPEFFTHYYDGNRLTNAIVWIGCCDGYRNDTLVKAFAVCGAKAVLACTETVSTAYNYLMQDAVVYMLLCGNTVEESLDFAKSMWGENDKVFVEEYSDLVDYDPSEVRIYNGNKTTLVTLTNEARISNPISQVIKSIEFSVSDWGNHATITAYVENGDSAWIYETPQFEPTELPRVSEIGRKDNRYYLVQDGAVIALDLQSGNIVWKNEDFGGSGTGIALGENAIYLCGQYGPDFYAISYDGVTLSRIESFDPEYYWASEIELSDKQATVYLHGGTEDYNNPKLFFVDLETYAVGTDVENAQSSDLPITSNDVLNNIVGDWTDGHTEYRFFANETFEQNSVFFSSVNRQLISRNAVQQGVIEVTGINTADLAPYTQPGSLQSWMKLIYDFQTDTVYVGNTSHPYYRMSNWINGNTPDVTYNDPTDHNSGVCGDNVSWALIDGVLTIGGTGRMTDYTTNLFTPAPWYSMSNSRVKSVIITDGVTHIGNRAFDDCNILTTVSIPSSVTSIGSKAFDGCDSLTDIYFAGNESQWNNVRISDDFITQVTVHYNFAIESQVNLPEVPPEKPYGNNITWTITDGVLRATGVGKMDNYTSTSYVPWYDERGKVTSVVMENGITTVGSYAFDGFGKVTSVTLPETIRSIEEFAFWRCDDLPSIVIPSGCTIIKNSAFNWCESLEYIVLPTSVTEIMWNAFANCDNLYDVYYNGTAEQWRRINISSTGNEALISAEIHFNSFGPD